ncbi:MAG: class I SAM-dependent methyltransferase [Limisphaerales bacterium]
MKPLDRLLQRWRFAAATKFIPPGARVLDVGCHQGELFVYLGNRVRGGVGIDPLVNGLIGLSGVQIVRGQFPEDLPEGEAFEVITAFAVLEHVPADGLDPFLRACRSWLKPGGRLVATVPSPMVDGLLLGLRRMGLVSGMSLEEHHGFRPEDLPTAAAAAGFGVATWQRFQLGLNNVFVLVPDGLSKGPRFQP